MKDGRGGAGCPAYVFLLLSRMSRNEIQDDLHGVDMPRGEPHVQTCRRPCTWYHMVIGGPDVPAWGAYKLIIQSGMLPEASVPLPIPSLRVDGNEYKEHQMGTEPNYQHPMPIQRRPPVYNTEERVILDRRKNAYLAADTKEGRNQVLKEMLSAIFNYWTSQGKVITNIEQTSKVRRSSAPASHISSLPKDVIAWVRNTWRLPKPTTIAPKVQINVKLTDALWLTRENDVNAEIASLLGVPEATAMTPGWFGARMRAMGNIIQRMSAEEKAVLEKERDRISREGHPEEIRRKYARCRSA
jgi:hypothetical protein